MDKLKQVKSHKCLEKFVNGKQMKLKALWPVFSTSVFIDVVLFTVKILIQIILT